MTLRLLPVNEDLGDENAFSVLPKNMSLKVKSTNNNGNAAVHARWELTSDAITDRTVIVSLRREQAPAIKGIPTFSYSWQIAAKNTTGCVVNASVSAGFGVGSLKPTPAIRDNVSRLIEHYFTNQKIFEAKSLRF